MYVCKFMWTYVWVIVGFGNTSHCILAQDVHVYVYVDFTLGNAWHILTKDMCVCLFGLLFGEYSTEYLSKICKRIVYMDFGWCLSGMGNAALNT